jgi:hypothetical protein
MPAKAKPSRAPKTTRRKVWVHSFYLLQPFVQFFALVAVLLIFTRCSPLAPSTNKGSALQSAAPVVGGSSGLAEAEALEQSFLANLKELSTSEMEIISETDQETLASSAPHADVSISEPEVRSLFEKRNKRFSRHQRVLFLPLDHAQLEAFFVSNVIRVDLSERLKGHTKDKARKLLFRNLSESAENKKIGGTAHLVLPDTTMQRVQGAFDDLKLSVKISLSVPGEDKAYLEIRRVEETTSQDDAALLEAALKEAIQLSILLE